MEEIHFTTRIDTEVTASVPASVLIGTINELPMVNRWSIIAQIINGVKVNLSDTTDSQREIIKKYLADQLLLF